MEAGTEKLLAALKAAKLEVLSIDGKYVKLAHEMLIEIENPSLFKLSEDGYVVAPFGDAEELAGFIYMDLSQRGLIP